MNKDFIFKEIENGNDKMGFTLNKEHYEIFIPKYYLNQDELTTLSFTTKKKIKKLLKAWDKYQKRNKSVLGSKFNNNQNLFNLNAALKIIQDYVEYGLYREQENNTKVTNIGKMNFKKTLNSCKPLYTEQGPIYLDYITDTKKEIDENIIRNIQAIVINDISTKIGWIIGFQVNIPITHPVKLNNICIMQLKETLNQSFNTRKINLIKLLIDYISSYHNGLEEGKELFIGMANLFWQDMIDFVIGNVSKIDLEKYFYVKHAYYDSKMMKLPPLMPDSIYKDDKNIIIIDSKYYVHHTLPNNEDLNKQFIYMMKAYHIFPHYHNYRNCFILPTDDISHISKTKALFDIEIPNTSDLLEIKLIYANVNEILNLYITDSKKKDILKDLMI